MSVLTNPLNALLHRKTSSSNKSAKSTIHRCRDETKRNERTESKRTKIISNVNNVTTTILEDPGLWTRPEFC